MQPHLAVHRRRDENPRFRVQGQRDASQGVIRQTMRQLGQHIGRCRRNQQQVRLVGELDMRRLPFVIPIEQVRQDRISG